MWAPLALATALTLAPGQGGELKLTNARPTFGILGQARKDSKLLPGDILFVSFDIENISTEKSGRIRYSMALELTSKKDKKVVFTKEPEDMVGINSLGGSRLPAFALTEIGLDTPAGDYILKVLVTDKGNGKKASILHEFTVLPLKFGFTRLGFGYELGEPAPGQAVVGQTLLLHFSPVGFQLRTPKDAKDPKNKQPHINVEMRILEDGKSTLAEPFTFSTTEVDDRYKRLIPMQFTLKLNRAGTFKVVLKATDKFGDAVAEQTLDLVVK